MSEEKDQSTFTLSCWGCHKEIKMPYTGATHLDKQLSSQMKEGWVKRKFSPNAEAWFCGLGCAYQSLPAKQAEEWWSKQNQKLARSSSSQINKTTIYLFGVVVVSFAILLVLSLWQ